MGSLFSALQAIASPIIGILSDKYGRRKALLISMCGNIASVLLWLLATDFRTFLASRIVGGLSEGNVQIATAIATDISSEKERGSTMALVGACFSVCGPHLLNQTDSRGAFLMACWTDCFHVRPSSGSISEHHQHGRSKPICNSRRLLSIPHCRRNTLPLHVPPRDPPLPRSPYRKRHLQS